MEARWSRDAEGNSLEWLASLNGRAHYVVGMWASPEVTADRFVEALKAIAENTDDEDEQGRVRRVVDALKFAGRDVSVTAAAAALGGALVWLPLPVPVHSFRLRLGLMGRERAGKADRRGEAAKRMADSVAEVLDTSEWLLLATVRRPGLLNEFARHGRACGRALERLGCGRRTTTGPC